VKIVYKYEVGRLVDIPTDHYILKVGVQRGTVYLWALVNTDSPKVQKDFRLWGTGQEINKGLKVDHIGTCIDYQSPQKYVWHVFEVFK